MATQVTSEENPVNLIGCRRVELEQFFTERGENSFRAQQWFQWVYQRGVTEFDAMTDF